jgi:hypothetical protein
MIWFDHFSQERDGASAGRLCRRHAESLVPPKGWWVDDRRLVGELLFEPPPPAPVGRRARSASEERPTPVIQAVTLPFELVADEASSVVADHRTRQPTEHANIIELHVELDTSPAARAPEPELPEVDEADPAPVDEPTSEVAALQPKPAQEPAWTPTFDVNDDAGGMLNARSPLLSRAFGARKKPE